MINDKQLQNRVSNVCETNSESYGSFWMPEFSARGMGTNAKTSRDRTSASSGSPIHLGKQLQTIASNR